jgi:hypothetical protein
MQIQDLEYSEVVQTAIRGGLVVNKITIISLAKALSSARALAIFGDASARAISQNNIGISLD